MADVSTEIAIASTTLAVDSATITFSSISSAYTDLRLVITGIGYTDIQFQLNGDTGTNYSTTYMYGNGTAANSARTTSTSVGYLGTGSANDGNVKFWQGDFFSYAGSTYKTVLATSSQDQNGSGATGEYVSLWRSTAAITQITIKPTSTFKAGTTAVLYGIL